MIWAEFICYIHSLRKQITSVPDLAKLFWFFTSRCIYNKCHNYSSIVLWGFYRMKINWKIKAFRSIFYFARKWWKGKQDYERVGEWFDATRRAESEYHLGFSLKIPYNRKINDSRAETRVFRKPLSLFLFSGTTWRYDQR